MQRRKRTFFSEASRRQGLRKVRFRHSRDTPCAQGNELAGEAKGDSVTAHQEVALSPFSCRGRTPDKTVTFGLARTFCTANFVAGGKVNRAGCRYSRYALKSGRPKETHGCVF